MQLYEHIPNTPFVVKDSADREIDALIVFRESLAHIQKGKNTILPKQTM